MPVRAGFVPVSIHIGLKYFGAVPDNQKGAGSDFPSPNHTPNTEYFPPIISDNPLLANT
jgi:hypothetical protein